MAAYRSCVLRASSVDAYRSHHSLANSSSVTWLCFTLASSPSCFRRRISVSNRSASARRSNEVTCSRWATSVGGQLEDALLWLPADRFADTT